MDHFLRFRDIRDQVFKSDFRGFKGPSGSPALVVLLVCSATNSRDKSKQRNMNCTESSEAGAAVEQ